MHFGSFVFVNSDLHFFGILILLTVLVPAICTYRSHPQSAPHPTPRPICVANTILMRVWSSMTSHTTQLANSPSLLSYRLRFIKHLTSRISFRQDKMPRTQDIISHCPSHFLLTSWPTAIRSASQRSAPWSKIISYFLASHIKWKNTNSGKSRDSSVHIAMGYGLDDWSSRVRFPVGLGIFLFTTASRTALGPTQPPIQWVPGALSLGVKRPGREADHSPPSSAEVKNAWSYTSTPPIRLYGVVLN
jgi:hypothetical protein